MSTKALRQTRQTPTGTDSYVRVDYHKAVAFNSISRSLLVCGDANQALDLLPDESVQIEAFQRDAPLIECRVGGETIAVVAVDRSDAKITGRNILISACIVHAEWIRT